MTKREEYILTDALMNKLKNTPESGMGYRIVRIKTKHGNIYDNVIIVGGYRINGIYGYKEIPFKVEDIADIEVTHLRKPDNFDPKHWLYLDR